MTTSPTPVPARIEVVAPVLAPSPGQGQVRQPTTIWFNQNRGGLRFDHVQQGLTHLLHGGDAFVFEGVCQGTVQFRIVWKGYEHLNRSFRISTSVNGHPLTLWGLAQQIVDRFARFLSDIRYATVSPGNERWDAKKVRFEDLVLVSVSKDDGHGIVLQAAVPAVRH